MDKIINIGDRVVMAHPEKANTSMVKAGSKGRVLALATDDCKQLDIFVDWDDHVLSLSETNGTNYGCKLGHGWWVSHASLELENTVKENKFKAGDRVVMAHPEKSNAVGVKAGNKGRVLAVNNHKPDPLDILVDWDNPVLECCHNWWVHHDSLELEKNSKKSKPTHVIVMKYDGTTTTAFEKVNDTIVAKAEARRHPDDVASSSIGFKLAFERLMDEVAKEDENKKKTPKPEKVWNINDIHVGDFVELRDDLLVDNIYGGFHLLSEMKFAGLKAVVEKDEEFFRLKNGYCYSCEMVKEVYRKVD